MNLVLLLALAAALLASGAYITITLVRHIPLEVLDLAQRHGRFAHLGAEQRRSGPARTVRVSPPAATSGLRTA